MRKLALGLLLVLCASASVAAQSREDRLQAVYERLCGPGATASQATCTALAADLASAVAAKAPPNPDAAVFGVLASREGKLYQGPTEVWGVSRFSYQDNGLLNHALHTYYQVDTYDPSGRWQGWKFVVRKTKQPGILSVSEASAARRSTELLADGSVYFPRFHHSLIAIDAKTFEWAPGDVQNGVFIRNPARATPVSGRYVELPPATAAAFAAQTKVAAQAAADEDARRRAERGAALGQLFATGVAAAGIAATGGDLNSIPLNGNALEILNGANAQLQQQNAQGKARLDAAIAQAQAQGAQPRQSLAPINAPSSTGRGAAPANSTPSAGAGTRTVRMVLWAGMVPTDADTNPKTGWARNPLCQSNIITATIRRDDQSALPEQELFERHRANFVAKCERLGTLTGAPTYIVETPNSSRFGEFGWNDRRVTLP